jgi:uncharacterized protein
MASRTPYFFFVYKDTKGEFRWRFYAPNNRIMADSGEGYTTRASCVEAINTICRETIAGVTIEYAPSAAAA